jgi:hypothetical protein
MRTLQLKVSTSKDPRGQPMNLPVPANPLTLSRNLYVNLRVGQLQLQVSLFHPARLNSPVGPGSHWSQQTLLNL